MKISAMTMPVGAYAILMPVRLQPAPDPAVRRNRSRSARCRRPPSATRRAGRPAHRAGAGPGSDSAPPPRRRARRRSEAISAATSAAPKLSFERRPHARVVEDAQPAIARPVPPRATPARPTAAARSGSATPSPGRGSGRIRATACATRRAWRFAPTAPACRSPGMSGTAPATSLATEFISDRAGRSGRRSRRRRNAAACAFFQPPNAASIVTCFTFGKRASSAAGTDVRFGRAIEVLRGQSLAFRRVQEAQVRFRLLARAMAFDVLVDPCHRRFGADADARHHDLELAARCQVRRASAALRFPTRSARRRCRVRRRSWWRRARRCRAPARS